MSIDAGVDLVEHLVFLRYKSADYNDVTMPIMDPGWLYGIHVF
jgi:hypothetical protein